MAKKFRKLLRIVAKRDPLWLNALCRGVAAGIEHTAVLRTLACNTVVDVGANRGQFALAARHNFPNAQIFSFEPLEEPANMFRQIFALDNAVTLHSAAIGPDEDQRQMHVSARDDSSSLLPISSLQEELFPGTSEVRTVEVRVAPLNSFLRKKDIARPALLKLDVQGFEMEALQGCESLLSEFDWIYSECSFVELYSGQKLAADLIEWLSNRGFRLIEIYNPLHDRNGQSIQADFLFRCAT